MSYRLIVRQEAENDLAEARFWYEKRGAGLGGAFLNRVGDVFKQLEETPTVHAIAHRDVRRTLVRKFPYVVYYRVQDDLVEIIAVLHGRQSARAWRSRL